MRGKGVRAYGIRIWVGVSVRSWIVDRGSRVRVYACVSVRVKVRAHVCVCVELSLNEALLLRV